MIAYIGIADASRHADCARRGGQQCGFADAKRPSRGKHSARAIVFRVGVVHIRVVDNAVADGEPGELAFRGPTLFSGYWRNPQINARDFRGGYFHMGDVFIRNPDGTLDFVDRRKYLIKSGGENIYPAEIENVLRASPRIGEAVVVRKPDPKWGETPVAFVVRLDPSLTADEVIASCRGKIAGYKIPRDVRFVEDAALPRSTTGKIKRHELEDKLRG